jgi:hypothetical protein
MSRVSLQPVQCWVDGKTCEVTEHFGIKETGFLRFVHEALPCGSCRWADESVAHMPGRRLGKIERFILLRSPAHDAPAGYIPLDDAGTKQRSGEPERWHPSRYSLKTGQSLNQGASRSDKEAVRRAMRCLSAAGLIAIQPGDSLSREWAFIPGPGRAFDYGTGEIGRWARPVRLTPLGEQVVLLFRLELTSGESLRWDGRLKMAFRSVRRTTSENVAAFCAQLRAWAAGKVNHHGRTAAGREWLERIGQPAPNVAPVPTDPETTSRADHGLRQAAESLRRAVADIQDAEVVA